MACNEELHQVLVSHTVKESQADDVRFQLGWTFDFSKTSREDVLKLATRTICIKKQAEWRKAKNRMDAKIWDNVTFMVDEVLAEGRKSADPVTRAKGALSKLTKAERAVLIADMAEEIKAALAKDTE
jgi:hypothetical protein